MKKVLILILIIQSCDGRSQTGQQLWDYSKQSGLTESDIKYQYYLPAELFKRDIMGQVKVDSFFIAYISASLKQFGEQSYSQKYLGGENYHFTWLRSFHPPVTISVHYTDEVVELVSRIGNKTGLDNSYDDVSELSSNEYQFHMGYIQGKETDSIKFNRIASKVVHHKDTVTFKYKENRKRLSKKEWEGFKNGLDKSKFLDQLSVTRYEAILDGAYWIVEANLRDGYKVIFRHSPDYDRFPEFRKICDMFIDMSDLKNEERY